MLLALPSLAIAQTRPGGPVPGAQQSRVHNPSLSGSGNYRGGGNYGGGNYGGGYNRGTSKPGRNYVVRPGYGYGWGGLGWGGGYPYYGYGGYDSYPYYTPGLGGFIYGDTYYGRLSSGPYYYPPAFVTPDEAGFGPAANQRFLGLDQQGVNDGGTPLLPENRAARQPGFGVLADDEPAPGMPRKTNEEAHKRAWRHIDAGDALFADHKFNEAYQRYRRASQAAPDLAEGYFRQGFGQTATGRFGVAARTFKRGLQIDPLWPQTDFQLRNLYGNDPRWFNEHLEALAKNSEEMPQNADLLFLLGIQLHFSGDQERARAFFERAQKLVVNDRHLQPFLRLDLTGEADEPAGDNGREL
jgi:hypothetical protein